MSGRLRNQITGGGEGNGTGGWKGGGGAVLAVKAGIEGESTDLESHFASQRQGAAWPLRREKRTGMGGSAATLR